jgi:phosphatidylglycerophosphatase A
MAMRRQMIILLATGGYIGKSPIAPGTLGTLWGLPIAFILAHTPWGFSLLITALFTAVAIWVAGRSADLMGIKDPGAVVIDEVAGMVVTLLGLPFIATTALLGFALFRLLDIAKPFPIGWLDRRLSGGLGIVADDVAAGAMANVILRLMLIWIG